MLTTISLPSPLLPSSLTLQPPNFSSSSSSLHPLTLTHASHNPTNPTQSQQHPPRTNTPTPPWIKGPLLPPPDQLFNPNKPKPKPKPPRRDPDRFLTEKFPGRMGKKASKSISDYIQNLQIETNSVQEKQTPGRIGDGLFDKQVVGEVERVKRRLPWESEERKVVYRGVKREKVRTLAELSLDRELLKRLKGEARKMKIWVKVNKIGVTEDIVSEVHSVWANNELVMFRIGLPLCRNMDRAREIVEYKTGGLVVWSEKDKLVAYRGCDYKRRRVQKNSGGQKSSDLEIKHHEVGSDAPSQGVDEMMGGGEDCQMMTNGVFTRGQAGKVPINRSLFEREGDRMLDDLGPRFVDWWYPKPLPVDADLLPEVVTGFMTPFRLPPPKVRPKLKDDELTYLRKFALYLPTHFVLGRNKGLQGLAASILKLWERCIIAKIAIKWGVPNTDNELMVSELKRLTGGVLLLRNKYFIIFYRGKDFLSGDVANLVVEREMELRKWQLFEEDTRHQANRVLSLCNEASVSTSKSGTLSEFHGIQEICRQSEVGDSEADIQFLAEKLNIEKELKWKEFKLDLLERKIRRATRELSKLKFAMNPSEEEPDQELMTNEERECLKRIGLKIGQVLVLGRRGVFDGVMEGIHQHWKHREVVKVISKQRDYSQVILTATMLERESGGVLVSVDKQKEGYSIIIYRGKNYRRPVRLGNNLLDKRKALKRSLEMQRLNSLKFIRYERWKEITNLKRRLDDLKRKRGQ